MILGPYRGVDGQTYYRHTDHKVCQKIGADWLAIQPRTAGATASALYCERPHPNEESS